MAKTICPNPPVVYSRSINGWTGYLCESHRFPKVFVIQRPISREENERHCEEGMTDDERLKAIHDWESRKG